MKIKNRIIIQDNFFTEKILKEINKDLLKFKFKNRSIDEGDSIYQKIYFQVPLDKEYFAVKEVITILNKNNIKVDHAFSNYFLSTKHEKATPHCDATDVNCLIYLKGNHLINSGTGFYDKINDKYELNTHVGFKENRAIIFDSKIFHCSLQFNENTNSRYVMANFFNYEE